MHAYYLIPKRVLFFLLAILLLIIPVATYVASQEATDTTTLSYQTFLQLKTIYQSGGQAPTLLAKVNEALILIQEAQVKRSQGDAVAASGLEDEARSTMQSVIGALPAAQEHAAQQAKSRTIIVVALIPLVVLLSSSTFYAIIRIWRRYEKMKLYEMKILEKKTKN
jgi:hypothetical protein